MSTLTILMWWLWHRRIRIACKLSTSNPDGLNQLLFVDLQVLACSIRDHKMSLNTYWKGGLNSENISEAVRRVKPFGVDLCGGVQTNGNLDKEKLAAFFRALEATDTITANLWHLLFKKSVAWNFELGDTSIKVNLYCILLVLFSRSLFTNFDFGIQKRW